VRLLLNNIPPKRLEHGVHVIRNVAWERSSNNITIIARRKHEETLINQPLVKTLWMIQIGRKLVMMQLITGRKERWKRNQRKKHKGTLTRNLVDQ